MTLDRALAIIAALNARGVRYAVFGGIAVNLTEDLDLFVDPDLSNLVSRYRSSAPSPS